MQRASAFRMKYRLIDDVQRNGNGVHFLARCAGFYARNKIDASCVITGWRGETRILIKTVAVDWIKTNNFISRSIE